MNKYIKDFFDKVYNFKGNNIGIFPTKDIVSILNLNQKYFTDILSKIENEIGTSEFYINLKKPEDIAYITISLNFISQNQSNIKSKYFYNCLKKILNKNINTDDISFMVMHLSMMPDEHFNIFLNVEKGNMYYNENNMVISDGKNSYNADILNTAYGNLFYIDRNNPIYNNIYKITISKTYGNDFLNFIS